MDARIFQSVNRMGYNLKAPVDFFFDSVLVPVNVKNVNEEKGHRAYDRKVNRSQGEHFQVKIRTWILCE